MGGRGGAFCDRSRPDLPDCTPGATRVLFGCGREKALAHGTGALKARYARPVTCDRAAPPSREAPSKERALKALIESEAPNNPFTCCESSARPPATLAEPPCPMHTDGDDCDRRDLDMPSGVCQRPELSGRGIWAISQAAIAPRVPVVNEFLIGQDVEGRHTSSEMAPNARGTGRHPPQVFWTRAEEGPDARMCLFTHGPVVELCWLRASEYGNSRRASNTHRGNRH